MSGEYKKITKKVWPADKHVVFGAKGDNKRYNCCVRRDDFAVEAKKTRTTNSGAPYNIALKNEHSGERIGYLDNIRVENCEKDKAGDDVQGFVGDCYIAADKFEEVKDKDISLELDSSCKLLSKLKKITFDKAEYSLYPDVILTGCALTNKPGITFCNSKVLFDDKEEEVNTVFVAPSALDKVEEQIETKPIESGKEGGETKPKDAEGEKEKGGAGSEAGKDDSDKDKDKGQNGGDEGKTSPDQKPADAPADTPADGQTPAPADAPQDSTAQAGDLAKTDNVIQETNTAVAEHYHEDLVKINGKIDNLTAMVNGLVADMAAKTASATPAEEKRYTVNEVAQMMSEHPEMFSLTVLEDWKKLNNGVAETSMHFSADEQKPAAAPTAPVAQKDNQTVKAKESLHDKYLYDCE